MRGEHIDLRPGSGSHQHNREEPRRTQETIKVPILSKAPCPSSGFLAVNCPRIESHQTLPPNEMNSAACPSGLIGIGGAVARSPLPHHRTCGSASGGSDGLS